MNKKPAGLADGMELSGDKVTSYTYGETTRLPTATYKDLCFGGRWVDRAPAVTEISSSNHIQGDVTITPIFEDIEVSGGDTLAMMIDDSKYSMKKSSHCYCFMYSKDQDFKDFDYDFTNQFSEIENLEDGTYYYQVRVAKVFDAPDYFDDMPANDGLEHYLADVVLPEGSADIKN